MSSPVRNNLAFEKPSLTSTLHKYVVQHYCHLYSFIYLKILCQIPSQTLPLEASVSRSGRNPEKRTESPRRGRWGGSMREVETGKAEIKESRREREKEKYVQCIDSPAPGIFWNFFEWLCYHSSLPIIKSFLWS